jgi:NAD(P)-dependent dehydrogenase (short-subunit alcohol dehydrogenase family)
LTSLMFGCQRNCQFLSDVCDWSMMLDMKVQLSPWSWWSTAWRDRIRINCLVPGWVITEKQRRLRLDAEGEAEIARKRCLPGHLQTQDLASAALFLAADDSRMCTGQDFIVDGGWV